MVARQKFLIIACQLLFATGCLYTGQTQPSAAPQRSPEPVKEVVVLNPDIDLEAVVSFSSWELPSSAKPYGDLRQHTFSEVGADFAPDVSSSDGRFIAFASTRHNTSPDIYVKPVNGTRVIQKTTSTAADVQPSISPDGRLLAFASNRNGNWDVFVTSALEEGPVIQVTKSHSDEITPSWSRDGSKIVFSAKTPNGVWEMWIVNMRTQSLTNIGPGLFPDWHPTKDIIVFQKPRSRSGHWYGIWTVDTSGNNLTEIVPNTNWAAINPSWSPDGQKIAFSTVHKSPKSQQIGRTQEADDVWIVNADGTNLMQLTVNNDPDWNPRWAPDGRIYFTSTRNGKKTIWSLKPAVFDLNMIVDEGGETASTVEDFDF